MSAVKTGRADRDVDGFSGSAGCSIPVEESSERFTQLLTDYQNLQRKLETLPVIEQAKGLLIGHYGIDSDSAFGLLQRWSSRHNVKLRRLCRLLVDAAVDRSPEAQGQSAVDHLLDRLNATPRRRPDPDQQRWSQAAGHG